VPHFRGLIELRVLILIEIGLVLRSIQADRTFSSIRGLVHINQKCIQLSIFSFSSRSAECLKGFHSFWRI